MATNTIQEWLISLGFDLDKKSMDGLNKGVEKAKKNLDGASKSATNFGGSLNNALGMVSPQLSNTANQVDRLRSSIGGMASNGLIGAGVVAGLAAIGSAAINAAKNFAFETVALSRMADQFRMTTDALDDYLDLAQVMDIPAEQASESLRSLDRAITDTALGVGRAKIIFEKLGIEVKNADGSLKSTIEVMDELRTQFKGMERAQAIGIMERLGVDPKMIRLFEKDATSIKERFEEIDKAAGFSMAEAEKTSKSFVSSWRDAREQINLFFKVFSVKFDAMYVRIMKRVGPLLKPFANQMEKLGKVMQGIDFGGFFEALLSGLGAGVMSIVTGLLNLFTKLMMVIRWIGETAKNLAKPLIDAWDKLGNGTKNLIKDFGIFAAILGVLAVINPFTAIIVGVTALAAGIGLLIEDFEVWQSGGDSLFGNGWLRWLGLIDMMAGGVNVLSGVFSGLVHSVMATYHAFSLLFGDWESKKASFESLKTSVANMGDSGRDIFAGGQRVNRGFDALTGQGAAPLGAKNAGGAPGSWAQTNNTNINMNLSGVTASDAAVIASKTAAEQKYVAATNVRNMRTAAR